MRLAHRLADWCAALGGVTLVAIILMTCVSVLGRALSGILPFLGRVPGDYELAEAAMGFAVFCFLPICQMRGAHATVDLFTAGLGERTNQMLVMVWEVLFAGVVILLTWRLAAGVIDKFNNGETTMFLQFKIWPVYAACLVPACVGIVVALVCAAARTRTALSRRPS